MPLALGQKTRRPRIPLMNVRTIYNQRLARHRFQVDETQTAALDRLQILAEELASLGRTRRTILSRWLARTSVPRGVYLWGGVGRGKSLLMDCFYEIAPVSRKTRIHFFEFMRAVHRELDEIRGRANPLDEVARHMAARYQLICFDEFHIADIADAVLLYRLIKGLLDLGTVFVMTSNHHPEDLYPNGLHRDRILPALRLIAQRLDVLHVDGGVDYRGQMPSGLQTYVYPLGVFANEALGRVFDAIATTPGKDGAISIGGREIQPIRWDDHVVWFDFVTLCVEPRSHADYLELASRFHTVLLSGVPQMTTDMGSEARRFMWLIDVLYDHQIQLVMSAAVESEALGMVGGMQKEFQRPISRIIAMQSPEYLSLSVRPVHTYLARPENAHRVALSLVTGES